MEKTHCRDIELPIAERMEDPDDDVTWDPEAREYPVPRNERQGHRCIFEAPGTSLDIEAQLRESYDHHQHMECCHSISVL